MADTNSASVPDESGAAPIAHKSDLHTLRRIAAVFKPYRWRVMLVILTIVVTALLGLVSPLLIRAIFDHAIPQRDLRLLAICAGAMFVVPVIGNLISSGQTHVTVRIGQAVIRDIRVRLFTHLELMSLRFYTGTHAGEIQTRLISDVNGIRELVTNTLPGGAADLAILVSVVIAMICISPPLTVLSFALLPVFILINVRAGKLRRQARKEHQQTVSALANIISETLSINGILLLKTFGRERHAAEEFERRSNKLIEVELRQQRIRRRLSFAFGTVFSAIPACVYLLAGWQMVRGTTVLGAHMTVGTLVAFTALQGSFFAPAARILEVQSDFHSGLALFDRIFEYLDLPLDIVDRPDAIRFDPAKVRGEVTFAEVSFTYPPKATDLSRNGGSHTNGKAVFHPTLKRISFKVRPGQMVALVGPSGAGKTTIAYLVSRLYEADSGRVMIDGHDVKDVTMSSLAGLVSVVTQETYLLNASVRENLLFARLDASDEDIIAAAKDAAIHDRIMEYENGYDTVVGERGFQLSGGEKQRIAIARAILKNPRILILDEATSALDTRSERQIQAALDRLMRGRTTVAIAHRLSTVVQADLILFIEAGAVVEHGTHAELLARNGAYTQLHRAQFDDAEESAPAFADRFAVD